MTDFLHTSTECDPREVTANAWEAWCGTCDFYATLDPKNEHFDLVKYAAARWYELESRGWDGAAIMDDLREGMTHFGLVPEAEVAR